MDSIVDIFNAVFAAISNEKAFSGEDLVLGGFGSYFCLAFWVLGIFAASPLRNYSATFRSWVSYGGRQAPGTNMPTPAGASPTTTEGSKDKKKTPVEAPDDAPSNLHLIDIVYNFLFKYKVIPRKYAFVSFYLVGAGWCYLLFFVLEAYIQHALTAAKGQGFFMAHMNMLIVRFLVLGILGIHCVRRFCETLFVQRFRSNSSDRVTVFAAVSGASFYVFAPLAFYQAGASFLHDSSLAWLDQTASENPEIPRSLKLLGLNVVFQVMQWYHHKLLANQRPKGWVEQPGAPAAGSSEKTGDDSKAPKAAVSGVEYHLPVTRGFFGIVQEPHYMLEIFIYFTLCCSMVIDQLTYEATHPDGGGVVSALMITFFGADRSCMWLVVVFTFMNLRTTAQEKRLYWVEKRKLQIEQDGKTDVALPRWIILPPFA